MSQSGPTVDLSPFDPSDDDAAKLTRGELVPCRACMEIFRRVRLVFRYCATCRKAACEGEHLTFAGGGRGRCVFDGPHP